jgi:hypothetical protein
MVTIPWDKVQIDLARLKVSEMTIHAMGIDSAC